MSIKGRRLRTRQDLTQASDGLVPLVERARHLQSSQPGNTSHERGGFATTSRYADYWAKTAKRRNRQRGYFPRKVLAMLALSSKWARPIFFALFSLSL